MARILLEQAMAFGIYWAIWLLVPLLIDVSTAVVYLVSFLVDAKRSKYLGQAELTHFPFVTVIIPVHNSEQTLGKCLLSIASQTYPAELLQVICVNNGSTDKSFEVYQQFHRNYPSLQVQWTSLERSGKAIALNAGLYDGRGAYLINVDADAWLDREAVMRVVQAFEADPGLVAATGIIRVDKELGSPGSFIDLINYCEVVEYVNAFEVGRRYQDMKNSLFSLSGAFSMFRRETVLRSYLYQERTLSEDTDLTYQIRNSMKSDGERIGCIAGAIAYVEPIESLERLYSQRVRWQRGELEVVSAYYENPPNALFDFTGRLLVSDHTLAFLRLAWTFLLPFLYFLGYSLQTVIIALAGMVICYQLLEGIYFYVSYRGMSDEYGRQLKKIWWLVLFLPFYRYLIYWFRMAGVLLALVEKRSWRVDNPFRQVREALTLQGKKTDARA